MIPIRRHCAAPSRGDATMEPLHLQEEYTDIKSVKHRVEHLTLSPAQGGDRDRLVEELAHALQPGRRIIA